MKMPKLPREMKIGIGIYVLAAILFCFSPQSVIEIFSGNIDLIVKILIFTAVAVAISVAISYLLPLSFVRKYLSESSLSNLIIAGTLGVATPGPIYAIYPIVLTLKSKGVSNPVLVAFITGQTILGPARIPFEMGLFGLDFMLYRLVTALVMAPLAGLLYIWFSKWLPDPDEAPGKSGA